MVAAKSKPSARVARPAARPSAKARPAPRPSPGRARSASAAAPATTKSRAASTAAPPAAPPAPPRNLDERRHVLSLAFLRDGDEFLARLETDTNQIIELKNRSLDQLLTLVASELEDLLE
jgi:hypothetical protein